MFNLTDTFVLLALLYFFYSGWNKGFVRSLSGPVAFVVCLYLGILYFRVTKNIVLALLISFLGPVIFRWSIAILTTLINKANNQKGSPSLLSSVLGTILSLTWNGGLLILVVLALTLLPFNIWGIGRVQQNILDSGIYAFCSSNLKIPLFRKNAVKNSGDAGDSASTLQGLMEVAEDDDMARLQSSKEFQDVMNDPRIQEIVKDEKVKGQIQKKDFSALLSNPKIFELIYDPAFVQKSLIIYRQLQEKNK